MNKNYTFSPKNRYLTRGVNETIPLAMQIVMWDMIDTLVKSDINADYLQVFNFKVDRDNLVLTHTQEQPEYKNEVSYPLSDELKALDKVKIFVIDDAPSHATMLLASEY